jgi:hypothetical protein
MCDFAADAVIASLPAAFTAGQQALGAIHFEGELQRTAAPVLADTKQCLPSPYSGVKAIDHVRRHLR